VPAHGSPIEVGNPIGDTSHHVPYTIQYQELAISSLYGLQRETHGDVLAQVASLAHILSLVSQVRMIKGIHHYPLRMARSDSMPAVAC
jgi:hypothetical protein